MKIVVVLICLISLLVGCKTVSEVNGSEQKVENMSQPDLVQVENWLTEAAKIPEIKNIRIDRYEVPPKSGYPYYQNKPNQYYLNNTCVDLTSTVDESIYPKIVRLSSFSDSITVPDSEILSLVLGFDNLSLRSYSSGDGFALFTGLKQLFAYYGYLHLSDSAGYSIGDKVHLSMYSNTGNESDSVHLKITDSISSKFYQWKIENGEFYDD